MTRRRRHHQRGHIGRNPMKSGLQICYRVPQADGSWKQKWETLTGVWSRKEARKILDEKLAAVNNPGYREPARLTFKEFVEQRWSGHVAELAPGTVSSYQSATRRILVPALGGVPLAEITPAHIADLLVAERNAGKSAKSRLNLYLLLSAMFNYARELDLIDATPMRRRLRPEVHRVRKPTLAPQQVAAVLEATLAPQRPLFLLLVVTGLRIGEALGLRWCDVDFAARRLTVASKVYRGKAQDRLKTDASERVKPLSPLLLNGLQQHRASSVYTAPENHVFCSGNGHPLNADDLRKRVLYPAMARAGVKRTQARAFGFHIFRHTAATQFLHTTRDLKATQAFLGHASINTTADVYAHYLEDAERRDVARLEKTLFGSAPGPEMLTADNPLVIVSEEGRKVN